jgi:hypothetical protein
VLFELWNLSAGLGLGLGVACVTRPHGRTARAGSRNGEEPYNFKHDEANVA